jgi:hypothetical protein
MRVLRASSATKPEMNLSSRIGERHDAKFLARPQGRMTAHLAKMIWPAVPELTLRHSADADGLTILHLGSLPQPG